VAPYSTPAASIAARISIAACADRYCSSSPAARAAAIRDRLQEVIGELDQLSHQDDGTGVPIEVLIGFMSPEAPDGARADLPGTPAAGA
jgi:hypothetical protein